MYIETSGFSSPAQQILDIIEHACTYLTRVEVSPLKIAKRCKICAEVQ